MSSLAAAQGIAFSDQEIRSALEAAVLSGFSGTLLFSIGLRQEAAKHVFVDVKWKYSHLEKAGEKTEDRRLQLPDPTLKKPVANVIETISPKLVVRTVATALEVRFLKGIVQPHWGHNE